MAQGKLSQQLQAQESSDQRITRTEKRKIIYQQTQTKRKFESLKAEAESVQESEFSNIQSIEEYRQKYNALRSDLKDFFQTPDQVQAAKDERIGNTLVQVKDRLSYAQSQIQYWKDWYAQKEARYDERRSYYKQKYGSGSEKYQSKKEQLKEDLRDDEDKLDEKLEYYQGYIKGLNEGKTQLTKGKEISYKDLINYADDLGDYEERKEEARNENKKAVREQQQKIEDLQEQGYTAYQIQKYKNGNPTGVDLAFYNAKTGDWQTVAQFSTSAKVNVSGLTKLGYSSPQTQTLKVGNKEFTFNTRVGIYKTSSGEIVTPYAKTGVTEQQLIKEAQDQAYADWKTTSSKNVTVPFKVLTEGKELPYGYGGQGTVMTDGSGNVQPRTVLVSEQDYYLREDKKGLLGNAFDKIKSGYDWVNERVHFEVKGAPLFVGGGLTLTFGKKEQPTNYEDLINKGIQGLENTSEKIELAAVGEQRIENFSATLQDKYSKQYQAAFEQQYMKGLIYNETTFEAASQEFQQSKEAQVIQKKYEEEYGTEYKKLQADMNYFNKAKYGVAQTGISLGELGLKVVKTPTNVAGTTAAVYTGTELLSLVPAAASYGISAGLFVYGSYKFLDPSSTYIEAGGGLVTATISGITLGYGAYKYLRQPVVKTEVIKPSLESKAAKVVGYEEPKVVVQDLYGKTTIYETTKYPKTLSRQVIEGRRTIVTSQGRELLSKYAGIKLDPLYSGLPYSDRIGYATALKRLTKYGYTEAQARATLRYYQPKVIETEISGINILTYGDDIKPFSVSETTMITKQPKIVLDDELGISTRSAKTIKDVFQSEKTLIGTKGEFSVIRETSVKTTGFLTDSGAWYNKITQAGKTKTFYERGILAKASDIKIGYRPTAVNDVFIAGEKYDYQILKEYFAQRQVIPRKLLQQYGSGEVKLIKNKDVIYIDQREMTGISLEKINVPKPQKPFTPIEKMSSNQLKDMIKDLQKIYGKSVTPKAVPTSKAADINKVIEKLDDFGSKAAFKTPSAEQSAYYGTGQYERTDAVAGFSPQQVKSLDLQNLKTLQIPDQKISNIKNILDVNQFDSLAGLEVAQLLSIKTATGLKSEVKSRQDLKLNSDLKINLDLKNLLKQDAVLKQNLKQEQSLKSQSDLKSILKTITDVSLVTPQTQVPRSPSQPRSFATPTLPDVDKLVKIMKIRSKKTKDVDDLYYLPDFTSRAIGLDPIKITNLDQANKILKKVQTGLELRRGVNVKIPN